MALILIENICRFRMYFRLSKEAFVYLLGELEDKLAKRTRSSSVPVIVKLEATFRFLADGSYQKSVGNDFNLGLAQPTFSLILKEMLSTMERFISPKWVILNMTAADKDQAKQHFFQYAGIPGVVSCVDDIDIK